MAAAYLDTIRALIDGQAAAEAALIAAADEARQWFDRKTEPCDREIEISAGIARAVALYRAVCGDPVGGEDATERLVKLRDAINDYLTAED